MGEQSPYAGYSPYAPPPPDPKAGRAKRIKLAVAGLVAVVVVISAVVNPSPKTHHDFTSASDYRADRDSGCTNSGEGCHGSEKTYADFNKYHPKAKCTSCHDYQGASCIPCHKPAEHECPVCHDGTIKNAPDTVRLSDPYPRGHYRETTHTATGMEIDEVVRAAPRGKAKATCGDCHSRDLKTAHTAVAPVAASPYGLDIGCGDCHNDVRTAGMAEVLGKWKKHRCQDCHKVGSSAPMHATKVVASAEASSALGCGETGVGCHAGGDLHALHADAPKSCGGKAAKGEGGCHDLTRQAVKPSATSCGAGGTCHRTLKTTSQMHAKGATLHSPENDLQAAETYRGVGCGKCHDMQPDGVSLDVEHALPTSATRLAPGDRCRSCHNDPQAAKVIAAGWPQATDTDACAACHGRGDIAAPHSNDTTSAHTASSPGCASSGPGCHPTSDLSQVGSPTTARNIHRACLRCHDRSKRDGNGAYNPDAKTCGAGRACHKTYSPTTLVHAADTRTDGSDSAHRAGDRQTGAILIDEASGVWTSCDTCHAATLGTEHARPNAVLVKNDGNACTGCHNHNATTARVVKSGWPARMSDLACASCHGKPGVSAQHSEIATAHAALELTIDGTPKRGACEASGCHASADLRVLHRRVGCVAQGCHAPKGDIDGTDIRSCGGLRQGSACHAGYSATTGHNRSSLAHAPTEIDPKGNISPGYCMRSGCHPTEDLSRLHGTDGCDAMGCHGGATKPSITSCGGVDASAGCHTGFSPTEHFVSHDAALSGAHDGVTYRAGENVGCFGCHREDLIDEHSPYLIGGSMDAFASSSCRVCHYNADDPGSGAFSALTSVKTAIAGRDKRCVACHASGHSTDGPTSVASPHKVVSDAAELPDGAVWADPFAEWKAAFTAEAGGGHNVLSANVVGAGDTIAFPQSEFTIGGESYTWALPPNSGATRWLRSGVVGDVGSDSEIRRVTITCDDCHEMPDGLNGPQGAAVKVYIDPSYSQTEYANPDRTRRESQFDATGERRVICFKCHNMQRGSVSGSDEPGGDPVHAQHAEHDNFPSSSPERYGERCTDCHIRIPHAWKHARLLIHAVDGDGEPNDEFPYVARGADGLLGVKLKDFVAPGDLTPDSCITGGCHGRHSPSSHPTPSDVPTATYWP